MKENIKLVKMLFPILLIAFSVFSFISYKNYHHNQAKKHVLFLIQQSIDNNSNEISYRSNAYELNGNYYIGRIYIVNSKSDLKYVRKILKKCKPLFGEHCYAPTNIAVFVGDLNIGYAGGSGHYYWSDKDGNRYGFVLPRKYDIQLWEFLESLEYIEAKI